MCNYNVGIFFKKHPARKRNTNSTIIQKRIWLILTNLLWNLNNTIKDSITINYMFFFSRKSSIFETGRQQLAHDTERIAPSFAQTSTLGPQSKQHITYRRRRIHRIWRFDHVFKFAKKRVSRVYRTRYLYKYLFYFARSITSKLTLITFV